MKKSTEHRHETSEPSSRGSDRLETFPTKDQAGSLATGTAVRPRVLDDIEPRIPVDATTTPGDIDAVFKITRAGSFYLTADVLGESGKSGIEIAASRVVLDLKGFALTGVTGSEDGILVTVEATDVTVRGGIVRDWGRNGLNLATASNARCNDVVASGNQLNGVLCGARSVVADCSVQGNGENGIQAGDGSTVKVCAAHDNSGYGISTGRDSLVSDCLTRDNSLYGISAGQGSNICGCTASANGLAGIAAQDGSIVGDCAASFNEDVGIFPGAGSTVSNCTISGNRGDGIRPGDGTTVTGCTMRKNGGSGIQISNGNRITGNTCDSNGAAGIRALGSNNRIEANNVTDNHRGLEIRAAANAVATNMVRGNRDNYDIIPGNQLNILLCEIPESIDWPASVLLAGSLTGAAGSSGITVNASDVTIDLGGHTLLGVPGSFNAIELRLKVTQGSFSQRTNVSVKNGTVCGWGDGGVDAGYADNGHYRELRLLSNGSRVPTIGPGLMCGSNSMVIGCSAMSNAGPGIAVGPNCCIRDCAVQGNGWRGISATDAIIHDCTAYDNKDSGINGGLRSTIRECLAQQNRADGIVVSANCYIVNNNCSANEGAGIRVNPGGQFNRIESNHVSDNKAGIVVQGQTNLIIRNSATHNGDFDSGTAVTEVNYDLVHGNSVGPLAFNLDNDLNPHANY